MVVKNIKISLKMKNKRLVEYRKNMKYGKKEPFHK